MPSNVIKGLMKKSGKSEREVEKAWDKAVSIAEDDFGKRKRDFDDRDYSYVTGIAKNMLGIKEKKEVSTTDFIESDISALEWLEKKNKKDDKESDKEKDKDSKDKDDDKKDKKGSDKDSDKNPDNKKDKDDDDDEESDSEDNEKEKDEKKCKKDKK